MKHGTQDVELKAVTMLATQLEVIDEEKKYYTIWISTRKREVEKTRDSEPEKNL